MLKLLDRQSVGQGSLQNRWKKHGGLRIWSEYVKIYASFSGHFSLLACLIARRIILCIPVLGAVPRTVQKKSFRYP